MNRAARPQKLPFSAKLLYGSGTIAFGVKDQGFSALLMLFYNQIAGLPADWVGAAIMIAMVVDAVIDPVLGQISDDFRSRWGRRHPFMYAAALPAAISYFFLWMPPAWQAEWQFGYLVAVAIRVRVSISLYEIPSTALLAEFSSDYDERTRLVAWRYFFGVVGGLAMTILAFGVFFRPSPAYPVGQLNPDGYAAYAIVAALVMFLSILLSSLGTQARVAALSPLAPAERHSLARLARHMIGVLVHPTYLSIILFSLFSAMSSGLASTLGIYFATFYWELSADQIAQLTSSAVVGIVLAFVLVHPLSSRFGKKGAAMGLFLAALIASATPLALRLAGLFPANGDPALLPLLMVQMAISTMCTISASILAVSMVADVTEQVRLSTGKRSEGLLLSAATMVNKAVSGMGVFLSGLMLTAVAFPANAVPGQVDGGVLGELALVYIGTTLAFSILGVLCLSYYPITRSHHADSVRRLHEGS